MKRYNVIMAGTVVLIFMAVTCFGAEATQSADVQGANAPKGVKDMTKEDILKRITQLFTANPNLIKIVPGIEAAKDESGAVVYNYVTKDGKKTRLEDIDKETLEFIYMKVQNEFNRISTEQTMRQMKEIRRIQELNRQMKALNRNPTTSTVTYKPVQLPKAPPKTYTAPKLPSRR